MTQKEYFFQTSDLVQKVSSCVLVDLNLNYKYNLFKVQEVQKFKQF